MAKPHIRKNQKILGAHYVNPYSGEDEFFPERAEEFTAMHLQILARNECQNTHGIMMVDLYKGLLNPQEVASIRCMVKATTVSGVTYAKAYGGYGLTPEDQEVFPLKPPVKTLLIDQAGIQWQGNLHNTGGLFFYPSEPAGQETYTAWQQEMYPIMYGEPRPTACSANHITVNWLGVEGKVDLDGVTKAIDFEFRQALDALVNQGNEELGPKEKICFRFLKAGMGHFASGLRLSKENRIALETARLRGIEQALARIVALPKEEQQAVIGKIRRLELPFSDIPSSAEAQRILRMIGQHATQLGIQWGGTPVVDALKPIRGYVIGSTTTADNHAGPGNEGAAQIDPKTGVVKWAARASVDANISINAAVDCLNAGVNKKMQQRITPGLYPPTPAKAAVASKTAAPFTAFQSFALIRVLLTAIQNLSTSLSQLIHFANRPKPTQDGSMRP